MRLRHILLKHKYEAEDVLRLLQQGQDFSELAKKFSQCPSRDHGGDLGDLTGKNLDPDFAEASDLLDSGQVSPIVRTRFGYHLIQRI